MPLSTALNGMNSQLVTRAIELASVVLPTPGGPQRMIEVSSSRSIWRRSGLPGPEDVLLPDVVFQALAGACARPADACRVAGCGFGRRGVEQAHARSVLWRRAS